MAKKLTRKKREEMWAVYQKCEKLKEVARKCQVHRNTVVRYRDLENWDERMDSIRLIAQEKAEYKLAQARAEDINLIRRLKREFIVALNLAKKKGTPIIEINPAQPQKIARFLAELIRAEMLLMGGTAGMRIEITPPHTVLIEEKVTEEKGEETTPR